jgi:phosphate uptake regulator
MDKRRIQLVGRSTLTVSLPPTWVRKNSLEKGDYVLVNPDPDGSLRIVQDSGISEKDALRTCTIRSDLCKGKELLARLIVACYVKGFDTIEIISSSRISNENLKAVRRAELVLMGLSIVEETSSSMTLQCSINPAMIPIDLMIRRLYALFSTMCDEAIHAFTTSNQEIAKEAQMREREANMMYALISRLLNQAQLSSETSKKIGIDGMEDIINMSLVANILERKADWAFKIAEEVIKIETQGLIVSKEMKTKIDNYYKKIKCVCDKSIESEFSFNIEQANEAIDHFKEELEIEAYTMIDELSQQKIFHGIAELRQIISMLRRIGEISVSIAESAIDRAIDNSKLCDIKPSGKKQ